MPSFSRLIRRLSLSVAFTLLTSLPLLAHATIQNGMNAFDALGTYDDSLSAPSPIFTKGTANDGPNKLGFNTPRGIAVDTTNHKLFLSDLVNNRILVFNLNTNNTLTDRIPDFVLGQANFYTNTAAVTQSGLNIPNNLAIDIAGNRLFVADQSNRRLLVFSTASLSNGMNASVVVGQSTFTSATNSTTQSIMKAPFGVAWDSVTSHLFVSDIQSNRVLVFSGASLSNGMNANTVIGQPNFTSSTALSTQNGLGGTYSLAYDSARAHLFVVDNDDSRVMVYSGAALSNGMNANTVIGQTNFTNSSTNTTQSTLKFPWGLAWDSTNNHLLVGDTSNRRVMVYSGAALGIGMNANTVIGQALFTTSTAATTQAGLNSLTFVGADGTRIYVADSPNNRVMIYSGALLSNGMNANDALGTYDDSLTAPAPIFTKSAADNGPNKLGMSGPNGATIDTNNHRLFVLDNLNNRVLAYNMNSSNVLLDRIPDFVLGQANFYSKAAATTQSGLSNSYNVLYDTNNNRLFVADYSNRRVLVFSGSSLATGMNANTVIGQTNFTSAALGVTQTGLQNPAGLAYDTVRNRLFVGDVQASRVLVYSGASLATGMNANTVIGQPNFTSSNVATTQAGMNVGPYGLAYDTNKNSLFVADYSNRRVLVFSGSSLATGMNANTVIGQANFTSSTAANTQAGMTGPVGLVFDGASKRLFLAENNRVLVYDAAHLGNGIKAANVLGQTTFTGNSTSTTQAVLFGVGELTYDATNNRVYVADYFHNRLMIFDAAALTITGKVYSDEGTTPVAAGKTIAVSVNGGSSTFSGTTIAGGQYTATIVSTVTGGTLLSMYLDNNSGLQGVTVTLGSGGTMTGIDLYQNHLIIRSDSGSNSITNTQIASASNGDTDISAIYTVSNGTLLVPSGRSLWIWQGKSFRPGGGVRVASGITIAGTLTLDSQTLALSGTLLKKGGGTISPGSSTVLLNGPSQTLSGSLSFYILTKNTPSATLNFAQGQTFTISNGLSLNGSSSGFLALRSTNQGAPFTLAASGTRSAVNLDVADSIAFGSAMVCQNCLDSGNNTNWIFLGSAATNTTSNQPGGGGGGGGSRTSNVTESGQGSVSSSPTSPVSQSSSSSVPPCLPGTGPFLSVIIQGTCITFRDVPSDAWYAPFVEDIISKGFASGYKDDRGHLTGFFGPANSVTLAEITKMALLGSNTPLSTEIPQNRSARNTWASSYIKTAEDLNLSVFSSFPDTNRPATRGEVASILIQTFRIPLNPQNNPFSDLSSSHRYKDPILTLTNLGIISGDDNATTVRPNDEINRAEIAKLISLLVSKQTDGSLLQTAPHPAASSSVSPAPTPLSSWFITSPTNLRSDARSTSTIRAMLDTGTSVTILRIVDVWAEVQLEDGRTGFVAVSKLSN